MLHPNCGGQLVKRSRAVFVPRAIFPKQRIYSIEGEFLREEPRRAKFCGLGGTLLLAAV
jgi:hypothetical protein